MTTSFSFIIYNIVYNVNQIKNKMMTGAVEIFGTNQLGNGRGATRTSFIFQRGYCPVDGF
ncbi:hypothetical protein D7X25_36290 [bacterium 1XD42-8]|nr:hypothetical protein D7X25_36290 [bacterium 1XD42-8]